MGLSGSFVLQVLLSIAEHKTNTNKPCWRLAFYTQTTYSLRKTTHDTCISHARASLLAYAEVSAGGDGGGGGASALFFLGSVRFAADLSPVLPAKRDFLSAIAASQALEARGVPGSGLVARGQPSNLPLVCVCSLGCPLSREFFQKTLAWLELVACCVAVSYLGSFSLLNVFSAE